MASEAFTAGTPLTSRLKQWPVQIKLVPEKADYSAAAWNLHSYNRHTLDMVSRNNMRKLIRIIPFVQLRASNQRDMVSDKLVVED